MASILQNPTMDTSSYQWLLNAMNNSPIPVTTPAVATLQNAIAPKSIVDVPKTTMSALDIKPTVNPVIPLTQPSQGGFDLGSELMTMLGGIGQNTASQFQMFTPEGKPTELMRTLELSSAAGGTPEMTQSLQKMIAAKAEEAKTAASLKLAAAKEIKDSQEKETQRAFQERMQQMRDAGVDERQIRAFEQQNMALEQRLAGKEGQDNKRMDALNSVRLHNAVNAVKKDASYVGGLEALQAASTIDKLLASGSPMTAAVVARQMAKLSGEKGVLSRTDVEPFTNDPNMVNKIVDWYNLSIKDPKAADRKVLSEADKAAFQKVLVAMKGTKYNQAIATLDQNMEEMLTTMGDSYDPEKIQAAYQSLYNAVDKANQGYQSKPVKDIINKPPVAPNKSKVYYDSKNRPYYVENGVSKWLK